MKRVIGLVLLGASLVASACNGDEAGLEIPIEAGPEASSDALSGFDASLLVDTGVEAGSDADSGPDSDSAAVDADAGGCPAFGDSGVTYGAACDDCGGERCCEPLSVCLGDPDCAGMASCWLACLASEGVSGNLCN